MELLIVTGMSGAGKTLVSNILEDIGFFCVDNLPPQMVHKLLEISNGTVSRIAVVMDVRGRKMGGVVEELGFSVTQEEGSCHILFLNASDEVLVKRFQEQRRIHPLIGGEIATIMTREPATVMTVVSICTRSLDKDSLTRSIS